MTAEELRALGEFMAARRDVGAPCIKVCMAAGCLSCQSDRLKTALEGARRSNPGGTSKSCPWAAWAYAPAARWWRSSRKATSTMPRWPSAWTNSGLRGSGRRRGGGYPAGLKWSTVAKARGGRKFVICNGDEGDPGAFMDRSVLESDPHRVIEGMAIAGYAVGAQKGYVYVRAEYPLAVKRLKEAIKQAEKMGVLGQKHLRLRLQLHGRDPARRRRLRLRRGDGADRLHRGQARHAAAHARPTRPSPACGAAPP
jgi:hypothetical protein